MNEDLMKMFGLDVKPKTVRDEHPKKEFPEKTDLVFDLSEEEPCHNSLVLDEWDLDKGSEIMENNPEVCKNGIDSIDYADFFAANYLIAPKLVDNPARPKKHEFLKTVQETSSYQSLRQQTKLNSVASEIAALKLAEKYDGLLSRFDLDTRKDERRAKAGKGKPTPEEVSDREKFLTIASAVKAAQEAEQEIESMVEMVSALGCGEEDATSLERLDREELAKNFQRIKDNPRLRGIIDRAGAYVSVARSKQRQKVIHGYDDMVGVNLSGELHKMLSSEAGLLTEPIFEGLFLSKFAENSLLSREHRGVESVDKGPIYVCVDESDSMNGNRIMEAKAFALAMVWIARHQKRWVCLVSFSGRGNPGIFLTIKPGEQKEKELLAWLEHFYAGGTSFGVPLEDVPLDYHHNGVKKGRTDIIILTDGIAPISDLTIHNFNTWKKQVGAKCFALVIGERDTRKLPLVSDEVHPMEEISIVSNGVQSCFGI